jgi:hypothetical protein
MIGNFDAFTVNSSVLPHWADRNVAALNWYDAIAIAAEIATTPWFWITSTPYEVIVYEVEGYQPKSPAWTPTRQINFKLRSDGIFSDWSTLRLVNTRAARGIVERPFEEMQARGRLTEAKHPVFFVSNGETNADGNWELLSSVCDYARRIEGVNGRRKMFDTCATLAEGQDFFIVTGKNRILNPDIFNFSPDPLEKRHWVFRATNGSNGLVYGHMGVALYNNELVRNTPKNFGLDFTMASLVHEVPTTASLALFATSPWEAWRTAFRECVKLVLYSEAEDPLAHTRLVRWMSFAEGENSEWVLKGAVDGAEFCELNKHLPDELRKTVEWDFLRSYWEDKYEGPQQ